MLQFYILRALKQLQYWNLQSIRPKSESVYGTCGQLHNLCNQYALDPAEGKCAKCLLNCYKCNDKNTCGVCMPMYFVDSNGTCTPCTANCESCQSSDSCLISCPSNCVDCSDGDTCTQCQVVLADKWILSEDCMF